MHRKVYHGAITFGYYEIVTTVMEGLTAPEAPLKAKTTYIVANGRISEIE